MAESEELKRMVESEMLGKDMVENEMLGSEMIGRQELVQVADVNGTERRADTNGSERNAKK